MRRLILCLAFGIVLAAVPTAAAASPTIRLALIHAVQGCHVWAAADSTPFGPTHTVVLKQGSKIEIRVNCPMDFNVTQLKGPKLALGAMPWHTGTSHTIVFAKKGVYRLMAMNVQSSAEMGLQTLGEDNMPVLTVRVS
jgi:hypothetical protein